MPSGPRRTESARRRDSIARLGVKSSGATIIGRVKLLRNCECQSWRDPNEIEGKTQQTYLVIGPFPIFGRTVDILVNASSVHHLRVDVELGVFRGIGRDIVASLERGLDQVGPFLVSDQSLLSINCEASIPSRTLQ